MFKQFNDYIHGQRGYSNQIYENISLTYETNSMHNEIMSKMIDFNMKSFIKKISLNNNENNSNNIYVKSPKAVCETTMQLIQKHKLSHYFKTHANIIESNICMINGLGI